MNRQQIVSAILADTAIKPSEYPKVCWTEVDGNAFSIMGKASSVWRKKDRAVAERIGSVLMANADSYDILLSVCLELCPMDGGEDEDEGDSW